MFTSQLFQHSLKKSTILAGLSVSILLFCSCDDDDNVVVPIASPITVSTSPDFGGVFDALIRDDNSTYKFTIDDAGNGTAQFTSATGISASQVSTYNYSNAELEVTRSGLTDDDVKNTLNILIRIGGELQDEYATLRADQDEASALALIDGIHATEPGFIIELRDGENALLNLAVVDSFNINADSVSLSTKRIQFFGESTIENENADSLSINPVLSLENAAVDVYDATTTYTAPAN